MLTQHLWGGGGVSLSIGCVGWSVNYRETSYDGLYREWGVNRGWSINRLYEGGGLSVNRVECEQVTHAKLHHSLHAVDFPQVQPSI